MKTKVVADFEPVNRPDLWNRSGNSAFYQVSPVKGAKIEGTLMVGMSSHLIKDWPNRYDKTAAPAMWVELTPAFDENGKPGGETVPLTINGKVYGTETWRTSARVELIPAEDDDHRDEYYRRVTVGGIDYFITSAVNSYDAFSESARQAIYGVIEAIAVEYVTSERWHAKRVEMAESVVEDARRVFNEAEGALDIAMIKLQQVRNETV